MLVPAGTLPSLVVCSTCRVPDGRREDAQGRSGGNLLALHLTEVLRTHSCHGRLEIQLMPCLFACSQACNVHLRSSGRMGYVLGKFEPTPAAATALLDYAAHYLETTNGIVPYARWPEGVKGHFIVRIPPEGKNWS